MSRHPTSRRVLMGLAGLLAVIVPAAGCPSTGENRDGPDAPSTAGQGPAEQPAPDRQTGREPGLLPDVPEAGPIATDPSAYAQQTPADATDDNSVGSPNPLRDGAEPPLREPGATDPGAAEPEDAATWTPRLRRDQEPFDPIKVNGTIFNGWPKPKLALIITGRQDGYLEPCGCAGLDRMKGGMSRRYSLFRQLRDQRGWPVVGIDVGGLIKGYGRQTEIKFQVMVDGMRKMGYDVIALGKTDLQLPAGDLLSAAGGQGPESLFIAANVGLFDLAAKLIPQTRIIEAGGMKLGLTAVLGKEYQQEIRNAEIEMADPEAALAQVVPDLKQRADYLVLLAHATRRESLELARRFPDFDLVVTAGGASEPPANSAQIEGTRALLIEVGQKGMDAIVLGMFDDPQRPLRYQRVPLDSRFPASDEMRQLMAAYQDLLKSETFAGLHVQEVPHPQKELNGRFVGSQSCKTCHEMSYIVWKKSGHARAYTTLAGLDPPRTSDPECISCHVVGWHPTEYYRYTTGYQSLEKTPHLTNTGCETCHGPGGAHVAAENGSDWALQEKLREAVRITKDESADPQSGKQHCYTCHDLDNSPDFDFDTYWPLVEHYEYDDEDDE